MSVRNLLSTFCKRVGKRLPLVFGMIHVPALPGTPCGSLSFPSIVEHVKAEAYAYSRTEIDGLIVENMHDRPYVQPDSRTGLLPNCPEVVAAMTKLCAEVAILLEKERSRRQHMLLGVQVLAGGNREALAVAQAAGFDFIRTEGFVFAHVADEGLIGACAGPLLRYRRQIGAENVAIFADIKKKHSSHAITADVGIAETAKAAEFFLADGLVITGAATGDAASVDELDYVLRNVSHTLPVLIGSGVTTMNVKQYARASAFIIGSHFKHGGHWANDLDLDRIRAFIVRLEEVRKKNV